MGSVFFVDLGLLDPLTIFLQKQFNRKVVFVVVVVIDPVLFKASGSMGKQESYGYTFHMKNQLRNNVNLMFNIQKKRSLYSLVPLKAIFKTTGIYLKIYYSLHHITNQTPVSIVMLLQEYF